MHNTEAARVTILTPVRDYGPRFSAYRERVASLDHPADCLRVIVVEGDSKDDTWAQVGQWAIEDKRVRAVKRDLGRPRYASVVHRDRFEVLSVIFNTGLAQVDLDWSTHVLMLPVDIGFEPDMLSRLLAHDVDMVSPLTWQDGYFYDVWAFVRNGVNFSNFGKATNLGMELLDMDTIGGTMLMRAEVLRAGCRYTDIEVDRGLCKMAGAAGFRCWADPTTHVCHPV